VPCQQRDETFHSSWTWFVQTSQELNRTVDNVFGVLIIICQTTTKVPPAAYPSTLLAAHVPMATARTMRSIKITWVSPRLVTVLPAAGAAAPRIN
jgi:hypothetical protein